MKYFLMVMCILCVFALVACQANEPEPTSSMNDESSTVLRNTAKRSSMLETTEEERYPSTVESAIVPTATLTTATPQKTHKTNEISTRNSAEDGLYASFTVRDLPSSVIPLEIERNKAFMLNLLPYQENEANRMAEKLYMIGIPEIKQANEVRETTYGYYVELVDVNDISYIITIREHSHLSAAVKLGNNGERIMMYNEMRLY